MIAYTTAERAYDWWYTKDLGAVGVTTGPCPRVVRKVDVEDARAEQQLARYCSGLHMAVDQVGYDKLVEYKLVIG